MAILVTGANGFIGSCLSSYLADQGFELVKHARNDLGEVGCWWADLGNRIENFPDNIDTVIHLAAISPTEARPESDFLRNNIQSTLNLVEACSIAGVQRLIFSSAADCYMDISASVVCESTPNGPDAARVGSFYGWTKLICEHILAQESLPFQTLILRLPGVIGAGCNDPWLKRVIRKMRKDQPIEFFAPNTPFNNTLYIDDLCHFIRKRLKSNWHHQSDLINLACGEPLSIYSILQLSKESTGSASDLVEIASSRSPFILSIEKAETEYQFESSTVRASVDKFLQDELFPE